MGDGSTWYYLPPISQRWLAAAYQAGGATAYVVGTLIWQREKLAWRKSGTRPLESFHTLSFRRVRDVVPISRCAFARALERLGDVGLIEYEWALGRSYRVRLVALPDEVDATLDLLLWSHERRPRKRKRGNT